MQAIARGIVPCAKPARERPTERMIPYKIILPVKARRRWYPFINPIQENRMNDSSHNFVFVDEDARCIECDCRPGGTAASKPCASLTDNVPCAHNSIAGCEQTIPWCTDCHQYIDQRTARPSIARTTRLLVTSRRGDMAECVELAYDRDTESYQYPEDIY